MIRSMTAFANREVKNMWGTAIWELRSVNQRYLETYIRLPEPFRNLEKTVRERIRLRITRGKVECTMHFNMNSEKKNKLIFNKTLAQELIETAQWIKKQSNEGEIDPLSIMRWPNVMNIPEYNLNAILPELLYGLENTLDDFINVREKEGNILKILIEKKLSNIHAEIKKIRKQMPSVLMWQHEKLLKKLKEFQVQLVDTHRLEQELVTLIHRIDIEEELDRLETHIKETFHILMKKEAVGRRLDFMMQEFNRESNTIASKSINSNITKSIIELKVIIEQIREQIQNIE